MKIVADENIPYVREVFSAFGDVRTHPGRSIAPADLADAEVLLVRSVTPVDSALLEATRVRFVGTATSGLDHIDQEYLVDSGIAFAHAIGANARGVAEYVVAAILVQLDDEQDLSDLTCGIVGYGHVGTIVYGMLTGLGMQCRVVDPFVQRDEGVDFRELDDVLDSDILTFHVPLTTDGTHPTHHMIDDGFLESLKPETIVINASRGGIADTQALLNAEKLRLVLDVWENEPDINRELLDKTVIGTPHIAGYSWDGKIEGTRRLFDAMNRFNGTSYEFPTLSDIPEPLIIEVVADEGESDLAALKRAVLSAYPIMEDGAALRGGPHNGGTWPDHFDRLRKSYWPRREFSAVKVNRGDWPEESLQRLVSLGFSVHESY